MLFQTPDSVIIQNSGLDAFFFLRYLRTLVKVFVLLSLILIPVLVPLNLIDGKNSAGGVQGLDRLSWANVGLTHTNFYWAHLVMALSVTVFMCHIIYGELLVYVRVRQAYFTSSQHRLQVSANTILVTDIPQGLLSTVALTNLYSVFPGGIHTIWINRDVSKLSKKIQQRRKIVSTLEAAETKLMTTATKSFHNQSYHKFKRTMKNALHSIDTASIPPVWRLFLDNKDRDSTHLPIAGPTWMSSIPFLGRKRVDTIDHCWQEMTRLNNEIDQDQQELAQLNNNVKQDQLNSEIYPLKNSAFIQFNTQVAAYMACQSIVHCAPLCLKAQYIGASPKDVRWESLSVAWWDRYIRTILATVAVVLLIVTWALPVAFTGLLSQISYLTELLPWLEWVDQLPGWLLGCIQGILPQVILTAITILLRVVFRMIAECQALPTKMAVEQSLQNYYFTFLFVQVFLTVSLSSSVTTIIQELIHDPESVPAVLARNLPKASNYFFSYILLQGLSISAGALIRVGGLINWIILAPYMDHTPRQKRERQTSLPQLQWGTVLPIYTNLACIGKSYGHILCDFLYLCGLGIIYSVIAPLILVFSSMIFGLFWIVFRYNILYVTGSRHDSGGTLYPTALKQLFASVYIMESCVIGLFFLVRDDHNRATCIIQAVIMIFAIIITATFHILLNNAFAPLLQFLPTSANIAESEKKAQDQECYMSRAGKCSRNLLQKFQGWTGAPTTNQGDSGTILFNIEKPTPHETDRLISPLYQHEALFVQKPIIWIPKDCLGISDDEILRVRNYDSSIRVSNQYATLDDHGKVIITQNSSTTLLNQE